ncbi:MAG: pilus assembly protein N-terminal domain-containing protein, partial [Lachnospiraceae bacterium]|nr:pilus assembly protein N-terminal domain-containing protein [Lachnospiraceae bacterium]
MRNGKRFIALLLTGVLAAGLAAAPAQVRAEETGESPAQEEVLKEEGKKEEEKASAEEKKEVPAEAPAEKSGEKTEKTVKEPAEEKTQVPDLAPEEQPAEDLAESPAEGAKLFGAEPEDPEGDGEDDTDDEPYYEYYDDVDDLDVVLGEEEGIDLGFYGTVYTQDSEEDFSVDITGAAAADPSVAEVGLDGQSVRITGKKIGSTRVTVTYVGPEGERKTAFTVHVKETVYDVTMYSSADEYYLEAGSSTDHWITVDSRSAGDYQNLKEDDVTVVWNYTCSPESFRDVFDLGGEGFSAVLRVDDEIPYHEALEV